MSKIGRPKVEDPRDNHVCIRLTGKEHQRVETYSRDHNQTITRTLLDGFELLTDLEKSRYSEKRE